MVEGERDSLEGIRLGLAVKSLDKKKGESGKARECRGNGRFC